MKKNLKLTTLLLVLSLCLCLLCGCTESQITAALDTARDVAQLLSDDTASTPSASPSEVSEAAAPSDDAAEASIDVDGSYSSKDDVALYVHTYGCLPGNFVTKDEAAAAGWNGGSVEQYLPGKCIGGDRFGNREGLLPSAPGRVWTECDIDSLGAASRGAKRIVFSNDGLIYYTGDHYESFQPLYN